MIARADFIRPSALTALEKCPGSAVMQSRALAMVPALARIVHVAAEQGTLAHTVKAQILSLIYHQPGGLTEPAVAIASMSGALSAMTPWAADACRRCVSYVVAIVNEMKAEGLRVVVEVEMHLPGKGVGINRGGTADTVILGYRDGQLIRVVVEDTKTGFLDQGEAADHLQLATYAVMAFDKYKPLEPVIIHLAQGRLREFSAASFDAAAIDSVRRRIRSVVDAANAESPALNPSIDACRYCHALTHCRAARERIMNANDELSMFGDDVADRIQLADAAAIAKRFAEEVKALQKVWQSEAQAVTP